VILSSFNVTPQFFQCLTKGCFSLLAVVRVSSSSEGKVFAFREVEARGRKSPVQPTPGTPQSVATISYNGGATGFPKGVVLTQVNVVASLSAMISNWPAQLGPRYGDVYLSYLSPCISVERAHIYATFAVGGSVAMSSNHLRLYEDISKTLSY